MAWRCPTAALDPEVQHPFLRLVCTALDFDSTNKALLLEMAQAWIKLAEQQKVEGE
jgi:hypothetical protein